MLELTYSNRTEALLDHLAERIRQERATGRGPWEPVHLVVPSPYLKEYLNLGLARKLGVAANLKFSYLDSLWKDLLVDGSRCLLAFDLLRAGLLCVLADPGFLARPGQGPVRDYLGQENRPLKRVQLAGELGRLFEEYQMSRPDWIDLWRGERPGKETRLPESRRAADKDMEAWQADLWVEVLRVLDGPDKAGNPVRHLTLLELIRQSRLADMRLPRAIHGFGLTHVAQAYQDVFKEFAPLQGTTLHLYALNPCKEYWDDLETGRDNRSRREEVREAKDGEAEDPFRLAADGPKALRLWGRPGREKIRLLNDVSECDFTPAFQAPDPATVLGRMQRDILFYQDPLETPVPVNDGSVRCLVAASPRREAEIVATEIWRLMDLHGDLGFSEIAVVVPPADQEAYSAHLQAAFHETRRIPMVQGTRAFPVMGQTLEAVELLLDLPTSGLTRSAVLRVLQHPGLQRRLGDLDTSGWSRWCQDYGIVRGADRAAWDNTYLEPDALNWDQGIKRMVLGEFMAEGEAFALGSDSYPVEGARDPASAAAFIAHVRGLCADARALEGKVDGPRVWMSRIWRYLERWLETEEGEDAEAVIKSLDRVKSYLERVFERVPGHLAMAGIDFPAARQPGPGGVGAAQGRPEREPHQGRGGGHLCNHAGHPVPGGVPHGEPGRAVPLPGPGELPGSQEEAAQGRGRGPGRKREIPVPGNAPVGPGPSGAHLCGHGRVERRSVRAFGAVQGVPGTAGGLPRAGAGTRGEGRPGPGASTRCGASIRPTSPGGSARPGSRSWSPIRKSRPRRPGPCAWGTRPGPTGFNCRPAWGTWSSRAWTRSGRPWKRRSTRELDGYRQGRPDLPGRPEDLPGMSPFRGGGGAARPAQAGPGGP